MLLQEDAWTSLELSQELHIPEREVFSHLAHVKKSLKGKSQSMQVEPYHCLKCDYSFTKRERLDRPGRCPKCRHSHISLALFSIT